MLAHLPYSSFENFLFSMFEPDVNGFLLCLSLCLFAYWSNIATLSLNDSWKQETAIEFLTSDQFYVIRRTSVFFNCSAKLTPLNISFRAFLRGTVAIKNISSSDFHHLANDYRCINEKKLDRRECHGEEKWKLLRHIDRTLNEIFEARKVPLQWENCRTRNVRSDQEYSREDYNMVERELTRC